MRRAESPPKKSATPNITEAQIASSAAMADSLAR
jgi:hypothetical protein